MNELEIHDSSDTPSIHPTNLPHEILANIFFALQKICYSEPDPRLSKYYELYNTDYDMSWIRATQVCKSWRETGIDCPLLWSELAFNVAPELTALMLARSKDAPLVIDYIAVYPTLRRKVKAEVLLVLEALSQTHRVRSALFEFRARPTPLDVHAPPPPPDPQPFLVFLEALSNLFTDAPILERFQLTIPQVLAPVLHSHPTGHHFLSSIGMALRGAPCLRRLVSIDFLLDWKEARLGTSLTHLQLTTRSIITPGDGSWGTFLSSLAGLSALNTLELCTILPTASVNGGIPPPDPHTTIVIPSLASLTLCDSLESIEEFMKWIQIPGVVNLTLFFCYGLGSEEDLDRCIVRLKNSWGWTGSSTSLKVDRMTPWTGDGQRCHRYPAYEITFAPRTPLSPIPDDNHAKGGASEAHRTLTLLFDERRAAATSVSPFLTLNRHFDLSASMLSVKVQTVTSDFHWNRIHTFPNLEEVHLSVSNSTSLTHFLRALCSSNDDELGFFTPFPALQVLSLSSVFFETIGHTDLELMITAMKRPEGHQVKQVKLHRCFNFTHEDYRTLRREVPGLELLWDSKVLR